MLIIPKCPTPSNMALEMPHEWEFSIGKSSKKSSNLIEFVQLAMFYCHCAMVTLVRLNQHFAGKTSMFANLLVYLSFWHPAEVVSHPLIAAPATPAMIDTARWYRRNRNEKPAAKRQERHGCKQLMLGHVPQKDRRINRIPLQKYWWITTVCFVFSFIHWHSTYFYL